MISFSANSNLLRLSCQRRTMTITAHKSSSASKRLDPCVFTAGQHHPWNKFIRTVRQTCSRSRIRSYEPRIATTRERQWDSSECGHQKRHPRVVLPSHKYKLFRYVHHQSFDGAVNVRSPSHGASLIMATQVHTCLRHAVECLAGFGYLCFGLCCSCIGVV